MPTHCHLPAISAASRSRCVRIAGFFFVLAVLACGDDGGSNGQVTTGSPTTSGGGGGGGVITACHVVPWTAPNLAAVSMIDFSAAAPQSVLQGNVCAGTSHYFALRNPCPGFLAVDLRGAGGAELDNDTDDLDLFVTEQWDAGGQSGPTWSSVGNKSSVNAGLPFETIHRRVDVGNDKPQLIEIRHVSGGDIPYAIRIQFFPEDGVCTASSHVCEATRHLAPKEIACGSEPNPSCPNPVSSRVAVRTVTDGSSVVSGWAIAASETEISYPHAPSPSELAFLEARCIDACEAEWADNPDVSVDCSVQDGFLTPRLQEVPSIVARQSIPAGSTRGEGVFAGQSLDCDLHYDCCELFDESLCIAAPQRATPAKEPLSVAEEYRMELGGTSQVTIATDAGSWAVPVSGTAGYGFCPGGNAAQPCPFYLGSLAIAADQSQTITLDCSDETQPVVTVEALDVSVVQPAFGIHEQSTANQGFPPGALVLESHIQVDGVEQTVRTTNDEPVLLSATPSSLSAQGLEAAFVVDCGAGGAAHFLATFDIAPPPTGGILDAPPSITITTPSIVPCGTAVTLTASTSDPDGDLAQTRWYIDDVLMASSVSTVLITQSHTLRAVARDARGAASTATKTIGCGILDFRPD